MTSIFEFLVAFAFFIMYVVIAAFFEKVFNVDLALFFKEVGTFAVLGWCYYFSVKFIKLYNKNQNKAKPELKEEMIFENAEK